MPRGQPQCCALDGLLHAQAAHASAVSHASALTCCRAAAALGCPPGLWASMPAMKAAARALMFFLSTGGPSPCPAAAAAASSRASARGSRQWEHSVRSSRAETSRSGRKKEGSAAPYLHPRPAQGGVSLGVDFAASNGLAAKGEVSEQWSLPVPRPLPPLAPHRRGVLKPMPACVVRVLPPRPHLASSSCTSPASE